MCMYMYLYVKNWLSEPLEIDLWTDFACPKAAFYIHC